MKLSSNMVRFFDVWGEKRTIDLFSKHGITQIDFNHDNPFFYERGVDKAYYKDLKDYANSKGVEFGQVHALYIRGQGDYELFDKRVQIMKEAYEVAEVLGAPSVVIHPIRKGNFINPETVDTYEAVYNYYRGFISCYENTGVKTAIENIVDTVTETADGIVKLYNDLNNPAFTVCYDVGHFNVIGLDPAKELKKLKGIVGVTHIHDNDGVSDIHTLPYYGNIDWDSLCKAFAEIGYDGNFNYEASNFIRNLPTELYELGLGYMSKVGYYLIDKIKNYK